MLESEDRQIKGSAGTDGGERLSGRTGKKEETDALQKESVAPPAEAAREPEEDGDAPKKEGGKPHGQETPANGGEKPNGQETPANGDRNPDGKSAVKEGAVDVLYCLTAAVVTSVAYHFFSTPNGFAPGGITGLATMAAHLSNLNMGWFMLLLNLPIFIAVSIFVNRKTGIMLCVYVAMQSLFLLLLPKTGLPVYQTENNLIYASIATGIISGFGFSLMLRRFGASGGTYAIASLIKRARPESNVAWVSFAMDASVVFLAFFAFGRKVDPVIGTLLNLFIADVVVDYVLSGIKSGYKFQIVTDDPEGLAERLMKELGRGVTDVKAIGMYTHRDKSILICIIRRRQLGEMMRILKSYPNVFASFEKVSEVFGRFVK